MCTYEQRRHIALGIIGSWRSNSSAGPLRGAAGIFTGLTDEVGSGRANREDDVRNVKRTFAALGRYEESEEGANGLIDRPLDTTIQGFQRDKGLRVDGFMRPGGPTERSLQDDLRGTLRPETSAGVGFGADRLRWPGGAASSSFSVLGLGQARARRRSAGDSG